MLGGVAVVTPTLMAVRKPVVIPSAVDVPAEFGNFDRAAACSERA